MSFEATIHKAQTAILRELLFLPATNFATLQKATNLSSDHVKFHVGRLVRLGYIEKVNEGYRLSVKGKEYANKLDTDVGVIERQPKVAVLLVVERRRNGRKEYLLQQRLKHPYFGFWGAPTGKVRWGESLIETAARELKEETGLSGSFEHRGIYHERVRHELTGEIIEDKLFHLMFCDNATGDMIIDCEGGKNSWRTLEEMTDGPNVYKGFIQEMKACIEGQGELTEMVHEYGDEEF
ncbi:MAG: NUDIX domain-containing protein [Candidatus Saccharibacteria bacterium]|nr:NUDIX domain-containing protein [Candidatus Saccharibacteria bacterium]